MARLTTPHIYNPDPEVLVQRVEEFGLPVREIEIHVRHRETKNMLANLRLSAPEARSMLNMIVGLLSEIDSEDEN